MLYTYLKIAWRHLLKSRMYSVINIAGLATGMAVALLIGLWIWDELSFNHHHTRKDRIIRLMSTTTFNGNTNTGTGVAVPLASELRNHYSRDFKYLSLASDNRMYVLSAENKKISQQGRWVQPDFTKIFTFRMLRGRANVLDDPSAVIITQSLAKALFGDKDPINQTVRVDNVIALRVMGVYEDLPENASFSSTKFLLPWNNLENPGLKLDKDWNNHHSQLYGEMSAESNVLLTNAKIKDITKPHIKGGNYEEVLLHPMNKWLLYDEFTNGKNTGGRIELLWLFGLIGFSILMLACINFMNLSTARSEKRAREVGIRKAIGSVRSQLIAQFLTESLIMVAASSILTIALSQLALPYFNTLADKNIAIPWSNPAFWMILILFTFFTALVSGSYPAFYLSGFKPIKVLKGTLQAGRLAAMPRKILVVIQFTVSIILIIGTLIVFEQVQYAKNRSMGYNTNSLITVSMNSPDIVNKYETLRHDLITSGAVLNVAASSSPSTNVNNHMMGFKWKGKDPSSVALVGTIAVTHDFGNTVGWKIKYGRDFSRDRVADTGSLILNESAVRLTGFKNPIGETMHWGDKDRVITGVINDMVMESPYASVQPTVFFLDYDWRIRVFTIKLNPALSSHEAISKVQEIFNRHYPANVFEYSFTDDLHDGKFYAEQQISKLVTAFGVITVLISCLGLFGLASFIAEQRTKEIGVRKVLGASAFNVWTLLSTDFVMLVLIAILLSIPIGWSVMNQWLLKYEYRIEIDWRIFALAALIAIGITLLTVSFQAIKAGRVNPVNALRSE